MENVSSLLKQNKIIVIGAGVLIVIFGVIFAVSILMTPSAQQTATEQETPESATESAVSPAPSQAFAQPIDNTNVEWLKALHTYYTINYLSSWTPETRNVNGGGSEAFFKPTQLLNGDVLPTMHIEVSPSEATSSISEKIATMAPFNLKQTSFIFHGVQATSLDGTLFEPIPNDPTRKGVYKKYIFFERGGRTYTITYAYYLVAEDTTEADYYRNLFETMLESFDFR